MADYQQSADQSTPTSGVFSHDFSDNNNNLFAGTNEYMQQEGQNDNPYQYTQDSFMRMDKINENFPSYYTTAASDSYNFTATTAPIQTLSPQELMYGGTKSDPTLLQKEFGNRRRTYSKQYGRVTPPDDNTPPKDIDNMNDNFDDEDDEMVDAQESRSPKARRNKQKRGSIASQTHNRQEETPKRRAGRQWKKSIVAEPEPEEDEKREKFLERNRVAASKCRQKKKEWTNGLEQTARQLSQERSLLIAHVASLEDELFYLKGECLKHSNCNCDQIRSYLTQTVARLTNLNTHMTQMSAHFGQSIEMDEADEAARKMSIASDRSRNTHSQSQSNAHSRHNSTAA